jgi:hypothetical protein
MMKRAFCARCGRDMALMIEETEHQPTCQRCLDNVLGEPADMGDALVYMGMLVIVVLAVAIIALVK